MNGRDFLVLAREIVMGKTEAHWRGAAGRAYYALLLECREALRRWGFSVPTGPGVHAFVRLRLTYAADPDLKYIGDRLERLNRLRGFADYEIPISASFLTDQKAQQAIIWASDALVLLDQIDADPARRAAAIAAIKVAWP